MAAMDAGRIADPPPDRAVPSRIRAAIVRGLAIDPAARHASMDALLAALAPGPGRRRLAIGGAVAGVAVVGVVAALALGASAAPCGGGQAELAAVWSAPRKAALRDAFVAVGPEYAADEAATVIARLDAHGAAWVAGQRRACEDTRVRRLYDESTLALRMDCYAAHLRRLGAVVDTLSRADAAMVERALDAVARLGPRAACDDVAALRQQVPPPTDPAQRDKVVALGRRLDELEGVYAATGASPGLRDQLAAVVDEVRAVDHPPLLARALVELAGIGQFLGDETGPPAQLREAIAAADRGRDDRLRFAALSGLIVVMTGLQPADAAALVPQAEATLARIGPDPVLELRWLDVRANVAIDAGDPRAATELYLEMVRRIELRDGAGAAATADPLMNAALTMTMHAPPADSLAMVQRAIAVYLAHYGARHPKTANARGQQAVILDQLGRTEEAETVMKETIAIMSAAIGADNPRVAVELSILAGLQRRLRKYDEARATFDRVLAIRVAALGPDHPQVAEVKLGLATLEIRAGRTAQALELAAEAERIVRASLGNDAAFLGAIDYTRGVALSQEGDLAGALAAFERSYELNRKVVGDDAPQHAETLDYIGAMLIDLGRHADAIAPLERALVLREPIDADPYDLALIRFDLARAYAGIGRRAEARALLDKARPVLRDRGDPADHAELDALERALK
jgi:tetratricopeptide (TPR) repeat protein